MQTQSSADRANFTQMAGAQLLARFASGTVQRRRVMLARVGALILASCLAGFAPAASAQAPQPVPDPVPLCSTSHGDPGPVRPSAALTAVVLAAMRPDAAGHTRTPDGVAAALRRAGYPFAARSDGYQPAKDDEQFVLRDQSDVTRTRLGYGFTFSSSRTCTYSDGRPSTTETDTGIITLTTQIDLPSRVPLVPEACAPGPATSPLRLPSVFTTAVKRFSLTTSGHRRPTMLILGLLARAGYPVVPARHADPLDYDRLSLILDPSRPNQLRFGYTEYFCAKGNNANRRVPVHATVALPRPSPQHHS